MLQVGEGVFIRVDAVIQFWRFPNPSVRLCDGTTVVVEKPFVMNTMLRLGIGTLSGEAQIDDNTR